MAVPETQIVKADETAVVPTIQFTRAQIELIKRTVAKGATDDELALFLYQAKRTGLDPLTRQIHFVKRRQRQPDGSYADVGVIQTGIDGFRVIAERSGYAGQDAPVYTYAADGSLESATVTVYRKGFEHGVSATAFFDEYAQRTKDGALAGLWAKMPRLMLAKCAEALALRKAFPLDLSGVYTHEEMAQADVVEAVSSASEHRPSPNARVHAAATQQQLSKIFAMIGELGVSKEEAKAWIKERYSVDSSKQLSREQASDFIDWLGRIEAQPQEASDAEPDESGQ